MTQVRPIAFDYIAAGINCTPIHGPDSSVKGAGKHPRLLKWQKKRLTAEEFGAAYRDGDNLGVITGITSGLVCVDCDKKSGGLEWLAANELRLGDCVRETTPGGGVHLYYRYPEGREFVPSRLRLFPGVDFLADGGKQVVTWPSTAKNGVSYLFQNSLSLLDVPFESDPPPLWILEEVDRSQPKTATHPNPPPGAVVDSPIEISRVREILKDFSPSVEGDAGDHTTLKAAMRCRDHLLSPKTAFDLLKEIYNPRCRPPWSLEDLKRKVGNAYRYAKHPAGTSAIAALFPESAEELLAATPTSPETKGKYDLRYPILSARRFIDKNQGRIFCDQKQLYAYDDLKKRWEMVEDEPFESILLRAVNAESRIVAEKLKIDQLRNLRLGVKRELEGLCKDLKPDTWTTAQIGEFVSCRNGILNIRTGELLPHDPAWFSFTTLPFDHVPNQGCPAFKEFLRSVWDGDRDLEKALQLWMGYILIRPMRDQKFAVLIGESRGGKSTLARVMEALVGAENTIGCDMMQFGDSFGLEPVIGKKLAVFSDTEKANGKEVLIATERIKRITGNDPITVNRKNKGMMQVAFSTKIVLVCNTIPPFINNQNSLTNRMIVFPFNKTFYGKEDLGLEERLMTERSGIFNWALEGAVELLGGARLHHAAAGVRKVEEISEVLDNVKGFISDAVQFHSDLQGRESFVSCHTLFEAYKAWCRDSNYMAHGKKRFFQEFRGKTNNRVVAGVRRDIGGTVRGYHGLTLDSEALVGHVFDGIGPVDEEIPF